MDTGKKIDIAQQMELSLLAHHKPIDEAIAHGKSPVQQFYRDTIVFITGGSGFLGKQLLEKLLRSCDVKRVYMLLRSTKGNTVLQRLEKVLKEPVFDLLRQKQPQFADKIAAIEGDITSVRLGLTDTDWYKLTQEVNIIIHTAATVKFDEPLKVAAITNVRGTMEALKLGKACKNLKCFTHVSTAYAHSTRARVNGDVEEKFYPCPAPPDVIMNMVDNLDEDRINAITPELLSGWPNTYTFTKAIAEEFIRIYARDMPTCIVKPPYVLGAYLEPSPGWIDMRTAMSSVLGLMYGAIMGVIHAIWANRKNKICFVPVDLVNNAIIVAGWDAVENRICCEKEPPMYTISNSAHEKTWGYFVDSFHEPVIQKLHTPKSVWYCFGQPFTYYQTIWLATWLLHYIPGYAVDALVDLLGVREKYKIPSLVRLYTKLFKLSVLYEYFINNSWNFKDDNIRAMIKRMSPEDRAIYNCDVNVLDYKELFKALCIGVRRYLIKDELRGTDDAVWRQKHVFFYANLIFFAIYAYVIYFFVYKMYTAIVFIITFIF